MTTIQSPTPTELDSDFLRGWHTIYRPSFGDLIAAGYINGGRPLSYGNTITGLTSGAGEVSFSEAKLGLPVDLANEVVYIVSDNAADTQEFTLQGLAGSGAFKTRTVTANGTTPVVVPDGGWTHVQCCIASGGVNTGTVYVSIDAAAVPTTLSDKIQTVMLPGLAIANNPVLACPNDEVILIHGFDFTTDKKDAITVQIFADRQGVYLHQFKLFLIEANFAQRFSTPLRLFEGDRLRCTIAASTTSNAAFGMNGIRMALNAEEITPGLSVAPFTVGEVTSELAVLFR